MENWTVEILNKTVESEIESLDKQSKARFIKLANTIENKGLYELDKKDYKLIRDKIWQLKACSGRFLYVTLFEKRVVVLHAFKKETNKLPAKNLDIAIKRLKLIDNGGVK